jgi:putative ABC transport system permease protein
MVCFAFIAGIVLTAGFLVSGAQMSVQAGMDRLGADMIVIPYDPYAKNSGMFLTGQASYQYLNGSVIEDVVATPGVLRASPQVFVYMLPNPTWCRYSVQLMGYDPVSDFSVKPMLLAPLSRALAAGEVVVGHYVQGEMGAAISIAGQDFTIVGRLEKTGLAADISVYVSIQEAHRLAGILAATSSDVVVHPGEISAILVKADKSMGIDPVLYWISSLNPGVLVYPMSALGRQVTDQLSATTQALYLTMGMVVLVSMPLVALISVMASNERRTEIGTLRALGASRSFIFRLIFLEAVLLAMIGCVFGITISALLLAALQEPISAMLSTPLMWPPLADIVFQMSFAVFMGVILAGIASIWPAYRASRMDPYESLRGA